MTVKLFPRLAVDHLQTCFQVLVNVQTINQVVKAVLEQNPQDPLISGQVPIGSIDGTKLSDTEHQIRTLFSTLFIDDNLQFFDLTAKISDLISGGKVELIDPIFYLAGQPQFQLILGRF